MNGDLSGMWIRQVRNNQIKHVIAKEMLVHYTRTYGMNLYLSYITTYG